MTTHTHTPDYTHTHTHSHCFTLKEALQFPVLDCFTDVLPIRHILLPETEVLSTRSYGGVLFTTYMVFVQTDQQHWH